MQNRNQFPELLNNSQYSIGVELGVFKGDFSKIILNGWGGDLYLVDVWRPLSIEEYDDISNNENHITSYIDTVNNISGFEKRAFMIRMSGDKAVNLFRDHSIDFIYIDANHSYKAVKKDIELWYPKIRYGGMISGHDYLPKHLYEYRNSNNDKDISLYLGEEGIYTGLFGVNPAVDEFVEEYQLKLNVTEEFLGSWWVFK